MLAGRCRPAGVSPCRAPYFSGMCCSVITIQQVQVTDDWLREWGAAIKRAQREAIWGQHWGARPSYVERVIAAAACINLQSATAHAVDRAPV